jgi:hypothetical protein
MSDPDSRDPRIDAAYRATPREEPPAELDERIRAAARRAVSAGPQSADAAARARVQRSWLARWRVPVSLAATVVIVVTLTVMMQDEESRRAKLDAQVDGPPPAAEVPQRAAPAAEDARTTSPAAQPFKPQPPVTGAPRAPAETPAPAPAPQAAEKLEAPAASGALSKERENRQADTAAALPPPAPAVQAAPAAPSAPATRAVPSREAAEALARDRAVADRPGRMERGAMPDAAEPKARTPEAWIEEIRRLKAQGRDAEAALELAEFRKRHPEVSVTDVTPA